MLALAVTTRVLLTSIVTALLVTLAGISASVHANPSVAWTAVARGDPEVRLAYPAAMAADVAGNSYVTGTADDGLGDDILTIKYDPKGNVLWRAYAPGLATAIAIDQNGNVYVTGNILNDSWILAGHRDFQTIKYAPDGTELWRAETASKVGSYGNTARSVAVDPNGNVYVTGIADDARFLSVKYDAHGVEQWRSYANQGGFGLGIAIAVDAQQNVFALGDFSDDTGFGYLTIRYDAQGSEVWRAVANNGLGNEVGPVALALDPSGNVVVTGTTHGSDYLNPPGFFTLKYSPGGQELWRALEFGPSPRGAAGPALAVDAGGNVYVTGTSNDLIGGTSFTTAKYAPDGTQLWRTVTPSPTLSGSISYAAAHAIAVDSKGGVYVTGNGLSGANGHYLTLKYDSAGNELWRAISAASLTSSEGAYALGLDSLGNVYVTGISGEGPQAALIGFLTVKYDVTGSESWRASVEPLPSAAVLRLGPPYLPQGRNGLAVDAGGNAYVSGVSFRYEENNFFQLIDVSELLTVKYDAAGTELWRASFDGGVDDEKVPGGMTVDLTGNVYVTGWHFDYQTSDSFLVKYDTNGAEQWNLSLNTSATDLCQTPEAITSDAQGSVYVACSGNNNGIPPTGSTPEYVTIKYDPAGNIQWRAVSGAQGNITPGAPTSIAVDGAGNTYVTGGAGSAGQNFYFTVKYDSGGHERWRATVPGAYAPLTYAQALAVDASGNVYVTGGGFNAALFREDFLTIKYDTNGNELWRAYGNVGHGHNAGGPMVTTTAWALKVDALGNAYVTGQAGNGVDFDYATIKYNAAGVQQWAAIAKGIGNGEDQPFSLALDSAGNVYVTGQSYNGASLDYLTINYDKTGVEQWRVTSDNRFNNDFGTAVALAPDGSVYVAGSSVRPDQPIGIMLQKISQGAPTTAGLRSSLNPAPKGRSITFTANVTGHTPTGFVDFLDGGTTVCGHVALVLKRKSPSTASCTTSALATGVHVMTVRYSGDRANVGSVSAPLIQTVVAPPPVQLTSSSNPSRVGTSVTFTATVNGNSPTGTVDFRDDGSPLCTAAALQGGGNSPTAACTTSALAAGAHSITAHYNGDAGNPAATSSVLAQTVRRR